MREIKFRGKRKDSGRWVYGDLIQSEPNKIDGCYSSWIIEKTIMPFGAMSTPTERFIEVVPGTVGQYAGIEDGYGKDIYEGDCLDVEDASGEVVFHEEYLGFFVAVFEYEQRWKPLYDIPIPEIIGNIHENPELLT